MNVDTVKSHDKHSVTSDRVATAALAGLYFGSIGLVFGLGMAVALAWLNPDLLSWIGGGDANTSVVNQTTGMFTIVALTTAAMGITGLVKSRADGRASDDRLAASDSALRYPTSSTSLPAMLQGKAMFYAITEAESADPKQMRQAFERLVNDLSRGRRLGVIKPQEMALTGQVTEIARAARSLQGRPGGLILEFDNEMLRDAWSSRLRLQGLKDDEIDTLAPAPAEFPEVAQKLALQLD